MKWWLSIKTNFYPKNSDFVKMDEMTEQETETITYPPC